MKLCPKCNAPMKKYSNQNGWRCNECRKVKRKYRKCPHCTKLMSEKAKLCSTCAGLARRGNKWLNAGGYVWIYAPEHFGSNAYGQIAEHRYVMELTLGRKLVNAENVHHINGNKLDNRPENLELWNTSQPRGQRVTDKVRWAREILALYDLS